MSVCTICEDQRGVRRTCKRCGRRVCSGCRRYTPAGVICARCLAPPRIDPIWTMADRVQVTDHRQAEKAATASEITLSMSEHISASHESLRRSLWPSVVGQSLGGAEVVKLGQDALVVRRPDEVVEAQFAEPNRKQIDLCPQDLDSLLPPAHRARSVWAVVEHLEFRRFYELIRARGSHAGRPRIDPKVLLALWLYATCEAVGSAHELERLCQAQDAYRWICGGVGVNYYTLSNFRSAHPFLDELLTHLIAVLMQEGLVVLKRVAHDSRRERASARARSFRRGQGLEEFVAAAREQVEAVKTQTSATINRQRSARRQAAQQRAARDRAERVQRALSELERIGQQREALTGGHQPKGQPRASTTEGKARKMKLGDGGFRSAHHVQWATGTENRVIVDVALTVDVQRADQVETSRNRR